MRIEQLTFTRFIAAIAIVIFHFGRESIVFSNDYISFIFKNANVGVSYFFVLSGFVMIIAYREKTVSLFEYLKNRFARIYPVYILAIVLFIGSQYALNYTKFDLLLNALMIQSWFSEKALIINYPGWSISVELFFYISFPFLLNYVYSKKSFKHIAVVIIAFWLLSQIIFHLIINKLIEMPLYLVKDVFYHPVMHFNEFLVGNLIGLYFVKNYKNRVVKNYFPQIILLLLVLLVLLKFPIGLNFHNGLLAIVFVPLIYFLSSSNDALTRFISSKPLVFLGEISYSIYILQLPIMRLILTDFRMEKYFGLDREVDITALFMLRLLILIVFSSLCYLYFEKPLRTKIKNIF